MVVSDIVHLNVSVTVKKLAELQSRIIHELTHSDQFIISQDIRCKCSAVLTWCNLNLQSVKNRIIKTHQEYLLGLNQITELLDHQTTSDVYVAAKSARAVFIEKRNLLLLFNCTYNGFERRIVLMRNYLKEYCHCPTTDRYVTELMLVQVFFKNIIHDSNVFAEDILIAIDEFNDIIFSGEPADSSETNRPVVMTDSGIVSDSSSTGAFPQLPCRNLSSTTFSKPVYATQSEIVSASSEESKPEQDNDSVISDALILYSGEPADSFEIDRPVVKTDSGVLVASSIGAFHQLSCQELSSLTIYKKKHEQIINMQSKESKPEQDTDSAISDVPYVLISKKSQKKKKFKSEDLKNKKRKLYANQNIDAKETDQPVELIYNKIFASPTLKSEVNQNIFVEETDESVELISNKNSASPTQDKILDILNMLSTLQHNVSQFLIVNVPLLPILDLKEDLSTLCSLWELIDRQISATHLNRTTPDLE